jgi:hypothetical protein
MESQATWMDKPSSPPWSRTALKKNLYWHHSSQRDLHPREEHHGQEYSMRRNNRASLSLNCNCSWVENGPYPRPEFSTGIWKHVYLHRRLGRKFAIRPRLKTRWGGKNLLIASRVQSSVPNSQWFLSTILGVNSCVWLCNFDAYCI